MKQLPEILKIVSEQVALLDWKKEPEGLYAPIDYVLSLGGKRLRPSLALLASDMFGGELSEVLPAALALELFHNFTLLHDDVMDKADIRRGCPTVHRKWNENAAILSGDGMVIEAYKLLEKVSDRKLRLTLMWFSEMASQICEGQQYDMDFEKRSDVTVDEYLKMIRLKTAVLLATALKMGAYIGNAPMSDAQHLYDFGINMGLAFQLKDDYLDVYGDEKTFGKAVGGDILCNKKTYMLISALKNAGECESKELQRWIKSEDSFDPRKKIIEITNIYSRLKIDTLCEEKMDFYYQQALVSLNKVSVPEQRKDVLMKLAKDLMVRKD